MFDKTRWNAQARMIQQVLEKAPVFNPDYRLPPEEFQRRQQAVRTMLRREGYDCGVVWSDEHYCGDVPYLAGNCNIMVEPIAAVLGENGLFFIAGMESGIVAEQFCHRSGVTIRRIDILNADKWDDPKESAAPAGIIIEACGKNPGRIALLTTRSIFPVGLYYALTKLAGSENVVDISEKYYQIKYEKSDAEMQLIRESCLISDVMIEGMLRILRPGLRETQVAGWGYMIAQELGVEAQGFPIMVTSGKNNRTVVGRASTRVIREGDIVHIGVSPKRDGLNGAQRVSVQCVRSPGETSPSYRLWMEFLEGAFCHAAETFARIAEDDLPGKIHEESMIRYYEDHRGELERRSGLRLPGFSNLKGYVTSHNSGYTECQEFYGALSPDFDRPCAKQMVLMLDAGLQGFRDGWDDVVIPGLDYIVIEKTAGKFGRSVEILNRLPVNVQHLVGEAFE